MRKTSRRTGRNASQNGSFWLSFSDLMSALLLVFVLVLFYAVYQYLDMLEVKTAELTRQAGLLDDKEAQLTLKDEELKASQEKLTESEKELITQQAKLLLFEEDLKSSEELLTRQRGELDEKNALLSEQQAQLEQAQAQLTQQEAQLQDQQILLAQQQSEVENARTLLIRQQGEVETARTLLTQQQELMAQQQSRLDALVGVRARIIADLAEAMQSAGIRATVDKQTGSITLDASVLFDVGQYTLKESGMRVLDEFFPVYLAVLMDSRNADSISEIIIEGHTDTDGTYMSNLKLSQERALSVMQYILSDSYRGITGGMKNRLRRIATANGRSYSALVYDASGVEDKTASRRVEFKFRLQDEQMIEDMRLILEEME
ncbi:MAG: OmpA family protein [Clostridiales bacterium]|jgi:chemotaxis protein MotB|nr:OmpA family protein [Bacillota bacterium]NLL53737.1 OmpA family protein [Clostridiales bacterium]